MKVKTSGDGARMSHTSSLFVCSFSLLEEGQRMPSSAGTVSIFNSNTKDLFFFLSNIPVQLAMPVPKSKLSVIFPFTLLSICLR